MTPRERPPGPKRRELTLRIASAVVLLPAVVWILNEGPAATGLLLSVAAAVATSEYYRIVFRRLPFLAWIGILASAAVPLAGVIAPALAPAAVFAGAAIGTSMLAWTSRLFVGPRDKAPEEIGHVLAGFLFTAGGFAALSVLRRGPSGAAWTMVVLAASWGNDTAAYFGGRWFGRHPLSPISPRKTWEGALAGLVGGAAALLVARRWVPGMDVLGALGLGLVTGVAGPLGDLSKSMLKRTYRVKDSSHLIPGHGGLLDRVDAVLFNAVVVLLARSVLGIPSGP